MEMLQSLRTQRRAISDKPGLNAWGDNPEALKLRDLDVQIEQLANVLGVKPWDNE